MAYYSETVIGQKIGRIHGVYTERISLEAPFQEVAGKFSGLTGTVALLSGSDLDCARYHLLAALPWLSLSGRGRDLSVCIGEEEIKVEADPFTMVRRLLNQCRLPSPDLPLPVAAGLFGYFTYDLKDQLERLPRTSIDDLGLPHICLFAPAVLLVQDRVSGAAHLCIPERDGVDVIEVRGRFFHQLEKTSPDTRPDTLGRKDASSRARSNFNRCRYMETIETIRDYIARGHVYQVNLSQRFQMDFSGSPWVLFERLFQQNPAPFFAFIQAGDHQVVSTSPERFIQMAGGRVEARPIKGTTPRGKTPEEDQANREKLVSSKKDDAELSMIVDLLRNDLGKVCEGGSVRVSEHRRVEAYQNVYHLVSIVEGVLGQDRDAVDFLRAVFPGGSITGCPKIRAMEIIDELESHRRHVYTGSIGYVSFHDTMDLSIAIRTATVVGGQVFFSVGGGIVIDSDPADEYEETLHKGRTLMDLCGGGSGPASGGTSVVWRNGRLEPVEAACIPVSDLGVQYGFGFFETIRVADGTAKHLAAHIKRFSHAWRCLFSGPAPDLTWSDIIRQVAAANGLDTRVAAVKILATFGTRTAPPYDHQVIVSARPYVHRLAGKDIQGLRLATYGSPRQTPLADLKTTNYLFYHTAGTWARENGWDEALVLNPDGSVSETNSANILLVKGDGIIIPDSPHVLPGIMQSAVCDALTGVGCSLQRKTVFPEELFEADMVLLTNALMGAAPVVNLDGREIPYRPDLCRRVNAQVL